MPNDWTERVRGALTIPAYLGTTRRTVRAPWDDPESSAALKITADGERWHDHRSGKGGDIFALIMAEKGCTFPEACRVAAERSGIPQPPPSPEERARQSAREELHADCVGWHRQLTGEHRRLIRQKWNIDDATIDAYKLGYCREGQLRGRIVVPWWEGGRIVYASGRVVWGMPGGPKYRNVKREGLDRPAWFRAEKGRAQDGPTVVVEGYGDALASPFRAAAVSSSTLKKGAAARLAKWAGDCVVLGDGDTAGKEGALKTGAALFGAGVLVSVCVAPEGSDPAQEGPEGIRRMVGEARPLLLAMLEALPDCDRFQLGQHLGPLREALAVGHVDAAQREAVRDAIAEKYKIGKRTAASLLKVEKGDTKNPQNPQNPAYEWSEEGPNYPPGYTVDHEVKEWVEKQGEVVILPRAAWIAQTLRNVESGEYHVDVRWPGGGVVVPIEVVTVRSRVTELGRTGLFVTSETAGAAVRYFSECLRLPGMPEGRTAARLGWFGEAFASGEDATIGDVPTIALPVGTDMLRRSLRTAGTLEGWISHVDHILRRTRGESVQMALWAAFAAPLLHFLPESVPNPVVDFAGPRGSGKTISAKLAASVWGAPTLVQPFEGTWVAWEQMAGVMHHHPLILDESTKVSRPDDVPRFLYGFANGAGRNRGARNGGLRERATFRGVAIVTGESPVVERSEDPGTRARVLTAWGKPLGVQEPRWASSLAAPLEENYGHAGMVFVRECMEIGAEMLTDWYGQARGMYGAGESTAERQGAIFAVLHVAAEVAGRAGLISFDGERAQAVWERVQEYATREKDPIEAALRELWEHAAASPGWMYIDGSERTPSGGWLGLLEDGIPVLIGGPVRAWLTKNGHHPRAIVRHWIDRGWLEKDAKKGLARAYVAGSRVRVLRLTHAGLAVAGIADQEVSR